jgi:hypothetical protein
VAAFVSTFGHPDAGKTLDQRGIFAKLCSVFLPSYPVDFVQRLVAPIVHEYLAAFRVVILNGPRHAGKTTLMRVMAGPRGQMRNLDDPTELAAAINDPVGFILTRARPLFMTRCNGVANRSFVR